MLINIPKTAFHRGGKCQTIFVPGGFIVRDRLRVKSNLMSVNERISCLLLQIYTSLKNDCSLWYDPMEEILLETWAY